MSAPPDEPPSPVAPPSPPGAVASPVAGLVTLPIVQAGDPVLRRVADDVPLAAIGTPALDALIAAMRDTMRAAPGVGLAAPQIGQPLRLVVIEDPADRLTPEDAAARERRPVPFQVLVNPRLTVDDPTPVEHFEGCLSVSGFSAIVPRAGAVTVEALDERGRPVRMAATGWHARILQHECDHLDGVLCIDRMHARSLTTHDNHARFWRALTTDEARAALRLPAPPAAKPPAAPPQPAAPPPAAAPPLVDGAPPLAEASPLPPPGGRSMKPLPADALRAALATLPAWSLAAAEPGDDATASALVRHVDFPTYADAIATITRVAFAAEAMDHHPDLAVRWKRVTFRLTTHDAGAVTERDLALARLLDGLLPRA